MPRYKLIIEYDGTPFAGWQVQTHDPSVQGALREAIFKFTGEWVTPRGAGRTDSGVHALGQVAHVDLTKDWAPSRVQDAINYHLRPAPCAVLSCALVAPDFDARFSAVARHYVYRILTRRAPPVLERDRVWWLTHDLNRDAMQAAARHLVGHHDFTTFRAAQCQATSPERTLDRLDVAREGAEIVIRASARSFLHNQVRSMVGTLKLVGECKWRPDDVAAALAARDRTRCGTVAPASGLYLERVDYPGDV
ncbi:MAG: tRNA pseudouridine(38-40) synthase TruA [Hyphomicrobium sp. 32-62-53]|nr:MAG: tRNA pseudouridine(38-40) synthase TruA [Hyphomicrobium sp. 12-62-95]OYX97870.1 MAG: tRNA pseudouridine(38-40) synthase TruA [Hyphomicrobium sp. 32-62-53]